jgi:small ligand-binding sensory domain FIST
LPGVRVVAFHVELDALPPESSPRADWESLLGLDGLEAPHFLLLPDPFTFDPNPILTALDRNFPESTKVGGLASGGRFPGGNALFENDTVHHGGLVGAALSGNLTVDTVVAQGCRPIGAPMFVTACEGGLLRGLDGRPPSSVLAELYQNADERDRVLFRHSLFIGLVMREHQQAYGRGDFLIRNLVGIEPRAGIIQVAGALYPGQVVQFHLRDALTSAEDLTLLLTRYRETHPGQLPAGSLLFSCVGRGMGLYGEPDHDTRIFRSLIGETPCGGFFSSGEIGPVQGTTFLHGYTSSFAFFRGRSMH